MYIDDVVKVVYVNLYNVDRMGRGGGRLRRKAIPGEQLARAIYEFLESRKERDDRTEGEGDTTTMNESRTSEGLLPDAKDNPKETAKEVMKDAPKSSLQVNPKGGSKEDPEGSPEDIPKPQPAPRNRRWNRIAKAASHRSQSDTTISQEPEKLVPWAPKLLSRRVPKNLRNLPYLMIGSSPEEFGDAFVFPLSVPGTKHVLGCLAIPRALLDPKGGPFETDGSKFLFRDILSKVNLVDIFPVGKDLMTWSPGKPRPDEEYRRKFSQDRLLRTGWGTTNAFDYQVGRFRQCDSFEAEIAFFSSYTYGNAPLIYPDDQEGPIAKTAQDYYLTLNKLCHTTQNTQKDFLEHIRYSSSYVNSRPESYTKSLDEVLEMLRSGNGDLDIETEIAQWAQSWASVEEVFLPEAGEGGKDDAQNAWNAADDLDYLYDFNAYYQENLRLGFSEDQPPNGLAPHEHLWNRELWTLIPHKARIPYWCQQEIFNCVNILLVRGIEKWIWPSGIPGSDLSEAFYFEEYSRPTRETAEPASQAKHFCRDPSCPLDAKYITKAGWQGFERVRAYALFQVGLCLLNGFGTEQDIEGGLLTICKAAEAGCRFARGVWRRLAQAYNRLDLVTDKHDEWLITEAQCQSHWALESFKEHPLFAETHPSLRNAMLYEHVLLQTQHSRELLIGVEEESPRAQISESILDRVVSGIKEHRNSPLQPYEHVRILEPTMLPSEDDPEYRYHLIRSACCFGPSERFERLLKKGSDFLTRANMGEFLTLSLLQGDPDSTLLLLARGAKLRSCLEGFNPFFLLHTMPSERMHKLVKAFVDLGFDINEKSAVKDIQFLSLYSTLPDWPHEHFKNPHRMYTLPLDSYITGNSITPLRWAIVQDTAALVRALLDHGAVFPMVPERSASREKMPQAWRPEICTAPILDQPTYNVEILQIFFEYYGEQASRAPFAETPLGLIAMEPDTHVRRLTFAKYANRQSLGKVLSLSRRYQPHDDARLFWAAVMTNHTDMVRELLREDMDVEIRFKGMTPLHTSILHGRMEIFDLLIEHGADVKALTTGRGISAMHLLFWLEKDPQTELAMLERIHNLLGGLDVSESSFTKRVHPLHLVVLNSRVKSVRRLFELGADVTRPLGEDIMPSFQGASMTEWRVRELKEIEKTSPPLDNLRFHSSQVVSLEGLTPIGIIVEREDMFLPEAATEMLAILLNPSHIPTDDISRFYIRPGLKQTILHLLPLTNLSEGTIIVERVKAWGKAADLDMNTPDIHGDTPLHYAYAFGGDTPLHMWESYHDADETAKNIFGLTPLESRLWKFMDPSCPEKERKLQMEIMPWGGNERDIPPQADSPLAQFWWEFEKGLAISHRWETKGRVMKRSSLGVDGIRLDNGEGGRETFSWGRALMNAMAMVP